MPPSSDTHVLVLGAGSAGARHARNLLARGARVSVADVDAGRAAAIEGAEAVPVEVIADRDGDDLDVAALGLERFGGVVVATPTAFHRSHALAAVRSGAAVLVEKPLAASGDGLEQLLAAAGDRLTVGYNLRLHRPVERVRALIDEGVVGEVRSVHAWFGSWLPDWRPDTDYRTSYSARAALGGGILLDASHEIDLLVWLFGPDWEVEAARMERRSDLEIDVEDTVEARLRSSGGITASIDLDCTSPTYRRGIEVAGDDAAIRLDWASHTIEIAAGGDVTIEEATHPVDDSYRKEAVAFLALVEGEAPPVVTAHEAATTVRLCDEIRQRAGWPPVGAQRGPAS